VRTALGRWGLAIDDDKQELMHYIGRKVVGPSPAIRLPNADGSESIIAVFPTIKWLGVYLDKGVLFNHHVKTLTACAENTVKGLSQSHLRHLYKACVIPVMAHASAAWWT
ncbi:hypothetical protein B0H13DRAFT_1560236, partial [Mycena leptocephala]